MHINKWILMGTSLLLLAAACPVYAKTAQQTQGKQLYFSYGCATCHGKNGDGQGIASQGMDPMPTDLRNSKAYHHGRDRAKIMYNITYGIKDKKSVMPAFDYLPHQEVELIAIYLESLMDQSTPKDSSAGQGITVSDAWVRLMPPSRPNSSAYMTIENKTQNDLILKSVVSDEIDTIEMHKMERANGMMTMRQANEILIPAGGKTELKPGGLHLMLFGIHKPLEKGNAIPMVLQFQDGMSVRVNAVIKEDDSWNR